MAQTAGALPLKTIYLPGTGLKHQPDVLTSQSSILRLHRQNDIWRYHRSTGKATVLSIEASESARGSEVTSYLTAGTDGPDSRRLAL